MSLREEKIVAFQRQVYIERAAENWKRKMAVLKEAQDDAEAAQAELIDACGNQAYEGKGIKLAEIERKGSVDYAAIPELRSVNLEQYRKKPSTYFKITLSLVN